MAIREFSPTFNAVYRESSNSYYSDNSEIRVGSSYGYNSYIGFPSEVRDALKSSKTPPKLRFKAYVTDGADFGFGAHKETYDKGSGTMPWYTYIGISKVYSTGWRTTDLTSAFMDDYRNGNYHGIVIYAPMGKDFGKMAYEGSNAPIIEVEGTWNEPPNKPTITYPTGGEVIDKSLTVRWEDNGDPDGDPVYFRVRVYDGNGNFAFFKDTVVGETSVILDTSNLEEGSRAYVTVRPSDDQGNWGKTAKSGTFTIAHNVPPERPTQLSPSNGSREDRTQVIRMSWRHNDNDPQAGFQLAWRRKYSDGSNGDWHYIPSSSSFMNTTNEYYNVSPNTFPESDIEWRVKTKDQEGLESPWSRTEIFKASDPTDAPIILSPSSTVNVSNVTVEWSSLDQYRYELRLLSSSGSTLWSETKTSSSKKRTIPYELTNGNSYTIELRVMDSETQLWSSYAQQNFTVSFTPPPKPVITGTSEAGEGMLSIHFEAGDASSSNPDTTSMEIYRREYSPTDSNKWVKLASGLDLEGSFIDYTPASGVYYEYRVKALNEDNGTSSNSDIENVRINFSVALLQEAHKLSNVIVMNFATSREADFGIESKLMYFAGRAKPVREFGENERESLTVEWEVDKYSEIKAIQNTLRKREVMLYRDGNGRRLWVTADNLSVSDKPVNGFSLRMDLTITDFTEDLESQLEGVE